MYNREMDEKNQQQPRNKWIEMQMIQAKPK